MKIRTAAGRTWTRPAGSTSGRGLMDVANFAMSLMLVFAVVFLLVAVVELLPWKTAGDWIQAVLILSLNALTVYAAVRVLFAR